MQFFHAPNKKAEREASLAMRHKMHAELGQTKLSSQTAATTFSTVVSGLLFEKFRVFVWPIPGKAVTGIVSKLEMESPQNGLAACRDIIVRLLRGETDALQEDELAAVDGLRTDFLASVSGAPPATS